MLPASPRRSWPTSLLLGAPSLVPRGILRPFVAPAHDVSPLAHSLPLYLSTSSRHTQQHYKSTKTAARPRLRRLRNDDPDVLLGAAQTALTPRECNGISPQYLSGNADRMRRPQVPVRAFSRCSKALGRLLLAGNQRAVDAQPVL